MKRFLLYLLTIVSIVACTEKEPADNDGDNSSTNPAITLNKSSVSFDEFADEESISFSATADWIAEIVNDRADDWLSITPQSGSAGEATITIKVTDNDTPDEHNASVRIKAGSASKIITVSQKQKDALTITSSKFEVTPKGGEVKIEVKANIDFEYTIDEPAKDWIIYEGTRAMKTSTLIFYVSENYDTVKREGKITIKSGEFEEVVTIYQAGSEPTIVISKNEYIVSSNGETVAVEVTSNVDVAIEMPADSDWISENTTRATSTNTYYIDIQPNEDYNQRTAEIKFTNKEKGLAEVVVIKQMQKDAIVLADSEYEFGAEGGYLEFEIQTNVDIVVSISDDAKIWIYHMETRALKTKTLCFKVWGCSIVENREGIITISGGNATQTIIVKQNALKMILEKEREALIALYNATGGDNWTNNENWCSDKPVSEWYGVSTYSLGVVDEIELRFNNLDGSLPEQIGELQYLHRLWLTGNNLKGELPLSLNKLTKLKWLLLEENQLSGKVSHIISQLPQLQVLGLNDNHFTGELPEVNDYMTCYTLYNNLFTGSIPDSHIRAFDSNPNGGIYNTDYGWLYNISGNNLSGKVPDSMVSHKNWVAHWREILLQNPGYGFEEVDYIPAPQIVVKCFDDSFLDLAEEYKNNQYTIVFRWDPYCYWSNLYIEPIYKLYNKYKDDGLGLVCTTHFKYTMDEISPLTSAYKDIKVFWEVNDNSWKNNPMGLHSMFFLFRTGATPYFHIIDSNGNIVFYGSGDGGGENIPQYHENRDDIYDFVANLFGDEKYQPEAEYSSTDYSMDGYVKQLQAATKGNGIDIVLMGDAYSDRLIADGTYDQVMDTAMEKFFMEEPYKSYRDHFNVYSITAVSKNEVYTDTSETAFAGYFGTETLVGGNDERVFSYAQKAIGDKRIDEAVIVVMMNSTNYAGTCYIYHSNADTGDCSNGASISYFPVGQDDNALAQVLHHETAGHGFSKLADEYAYEYMGAIPNSEISSRKSFEQYGWYKNVDFTNDPTKVKWSHFLTDARYANDGLGVYEGAFTYWTNVWRPTDNSIMRYNTGGFNAPSREAIYYRIHHLAYGADWEYDYEKFVEWDAKNHMTAATTRSVPYRLDIPEDFEPLHPPVVMNTSWRNAKNNAPAKNIIRPTGDNTSRNLQKSAGATLHVTAQTDNRTSWE